MGLKTQTLLNTPTCITSIGIDKTWDLWLVSLSAPSNQIKAGPAALLHGRPRTSPCRRADGHQVREGGSALTAISNVAEGKRETAHMQSGTRLRDTETCSIAATTKSKSPPMPVSSASRSRDPRSRNILRTPLPLEAKMTRIKNKERDKQ